MWGGKNFARLGGAAVGASPILDVGDGVVRPAEVALSAGVRGNPAGPHRGHKNSPVVSHSVNNSSLGSAVPAPDVVESVLGLAILGKLDGDVAVRRNFNVNLEGSVSVNGAAEVNNAAAAPSITAGVGSNVRVHCGSSERVAVALHNIKLNTGVALANPM